MKISKSLILTALGILCGGAASLIKSKSTEIEINKAVEEKYKELKKIEEKEE